MNEKILDLAPTCACTNIRQTEILVTQFYDTLLAPSGIYALQFGLLAAIANIQPMSINRLAHVMDMDRVALNRELKILAVQDLIGIDPGEDRGARQLFLTQEGEHMIERAGYFWQEAQSRLETAFGEERYTALLDELRAMRTMFDTGAA